MELRSAPLCFFPVQSELSGVCVCECVGEGGSGSDATDVGHVIQTGIKGGCHWSQNGGITGAMSKGVQ